MRNLSQKLLGGALAFGVVSVVSTVIAHAQSYSAYYDDSYYGNTAADGIFGGASLLMTCVWCCFGLVILAFPLICAIVVYKDAKKYNVENGFLWAILTFFFNIIGLLIYFLAIKPEAVRKHQSAHGTTPAPTAKPAEVASTPVETKTEETK
jgi:ABC-type transport system involved in multi-copper enzyme maturation permease subunit